MEVVEQIVAREEGEEAHGDLEHVLWMEGQEVAVTWYPNLMWQA